MPLALEVSMKKEEKGRWVIILDPKSGAKLHYSHFADNDKTLEFYFSDKVPLTGKLLVEIEMTDRESEALREAIGVYAKKNAKTPGGHSISAEMDVVNAIQKVFETGSNHGWNLARERARERT